MSRRLVLGGLASVCILGIAAPLSAQTAKSLQGEVIDPALYLREGRHGQEAEDLIYDAADSGQTLALLEDGTGAVYLLLAGEPGDDPNESAYEYVGRRIKATGTIYERGKLWGIVVTNVEPLEAPATPSSESTDQSAEE